MIRSFLVNSDEKNEILRGSIWKNMALFALPLALSSILQQFFNSADTATVGHFAGSAALAAVGANVANTGVFVNFIVGSSIGPNVIIARLIGLGRKDEIHSSIHAIMAFAMVCGLVLMAIGEAMARPLLSWSATPKEVFLLAETYLRIYLLGVPFMVWYNFAAGIQRSHGDTKTPLVCMVISGIVNAVLNLVFVIVFHLDAAGVAIATSISNALSAFLITWKMMREEETFRFSFPDVHMDHFISRRIASIGFPAGIQMAVFSVSNMFIQTAINSYGSFAIAGSSAALNFEYFAYDLSVAFAQGAVTWYSQNLGAGNMERCRDTFRIAMIEGIGSAELLSLIFLAAGAHAVHFYTMDPEVVAFALERMKYVLSLEGFTGTYEITAGVLRSRGANLTPSIITIMGTVVFRIVWLLTVYRLHTSFAVLMLVYPFSWFAAFLALYAAYRMSFHRRLA